jgi:hypothetical protein
MTGSRGTKCVHGSNRYLKVLYKYPYSQPYLFRSKQKKARSFDSHWDLERYVLLNLFRTKTASFFRIVPPRTLTVFALGREPQTTMKIRVTWSRLESSGALTAFASVVSGARCISGCPLAYVPQRGVRNRLIIGAVGICNTQ